MASSKGMVKGKAKGMKKKADMAKNMGRKGTMGRKG